MYCSPERISGQGVEGRSSQVRQYDNAGKGREMEDDDEQNGGKGG